MLAKLAQAKAYKQDKSKQGGAPVILETQSASHKPSQAPSQPKDSFSSTQRTSVQLASPGASDQRPTDQQQPENQTGFEGRGSAAQPARFLEQVMQKQSEDSKKMSAEAYSLLKEQQKRNQKVSPEAGSVIMLSHLVTPDIILQLHLAVPCYVYLVCCQHNLKYQHWCMQQP